MQVGLRNDCFSPYKKNIVIRLSFIVFLILLCRKLQAQPSPYGSDLIISFKNNKEYKVLWIKEKGETVEVKREKGSYRIKAFRSPLGGGVSGYLRIIHKADTMNFIHPLIDQSSPTIFNDILFRKGTYAIPKYVYQVNNLFKLEFRRKIKPSLSGDWSAFEVTKKNTTQGVYLRRLELFKEREIIGSLLPVFPNRTLTSCNADLIKHWFIREEIKDKFIGNCVSKFHKYHFFSLLKNTGLYFLQRKENDILEYGILQIPVNTEGIQQKKEGCYKGLLYPNLEEQIVFDIYTYQQGDFPKVLGYYNGKKKCDESFGSTKNMWGIFKIYMNPNDSIKTLIREEHTKDNNLRREE
ncbi:hypothetical protein [Tenacibaculum jejuense]|uniref:Uncharacterized protein n=1 Tax=Tenacibaculum jejuense TaxID=584609 RepID=A0A238UDM8_9FLAO|nr:hypothetical protein [Tenacibaculum jejuense]SNR17182.1 Protein of unknown function [Tenacibaculum jejuense]